VRMTRRHPWRRAMLGMLRSSRLPAIALARRVGLLAARGCRRVRRRRLGAPCSWGLLAGGSRHSAIRWWQRLRHWAWFGCCLSCRIQARWRHHHRNLWVPQLCLHQRGINTQRQCGSRDRRGSNDRRGVLRCQLSLRRCGTHGCSCCVGRRERAHQGPQGVEHVRGRDGGRHRRRERWQDIRPARRQLLGRKPLRHHRPGRRRDDDRRPLGQCPGQRSPGRWWDHHGSAKQLVCTCSDEGHELWQLRWLRELRWGIRPHCPHTERRGGERGPPPSRGRRPLRPEPPARPPLRSPDSTAAPAP